MSTEVKLLCGRTVEGVQFEVVLERIAIQLNVQAAEFKVTIT